MKKLVFALVSGLLIQAPGMLNAASLTGTVNFDGTPMKPRKINMAADPTCQKLNASPATSEKVVVNGNKTLKNVFVYIKDGLPKKAYPTPGTQKVVLDQKGCRYIPHVFGVMVNQPIEIVNSDSTLHNVHAMPKKNKEFNLGMPMKDMRMTRKFDKPEIGAKFKCDVHPWMNAWAHVMEHPFFAVTDDQGAFEIKDLPAGTYTAVAWQEKLGTQEAKVTVADGKPATVSFTFAGKGAAAAQK